MSQNNIKLLYRYVFKNISVPNNRILFFDSIKERIDDFKINEFNNEEEKQNKISEWNNFINNFLKMKFHIDNENRLLESHNINIVRDSKKDIESVARKVGLEI
jgi:hypothetical protein